MAGYVLTPLARRQLGEIWHYISIDNLDAADRLVERIYNACRMLAENPKIGHFREEIADTAYRFWSVSPILIVYRWEAQPLSVIAIPHGARDLRTLLSDLDE